MKVPGLAIVPEVGEAQIEFGYESGPDSPAVLALTGGEVLRLVLTGFGAIALGSVMVRRRKRTE